MLCVCEQCETRLRKGRTREICGACQFSRLRFYAPQAHVTFWMLKNSRCWWTQTISNIRLHGYWIRMEKTKINQCTLMTILFSAQLKIESKNCNIPIFIYLKIENKKFNTNVLVLKKSNKMWKFFLIVFIFNFVNWLMVNHYLTVISYQAFIAKYLNVGSAKLRALCAHILACFWCLRALLPTCLVCFSWLRAYQLTCYNYK